MRAHKMYVNISHAWFLKYGLWQGLYTRKLVMPAVLGVMTMVGHLLGGVDKNPLTVVYSIFLALWSTLFLEGAFPYNP